jgi:peptidoglycan hydrolase CwlO-like protein
MKNNVAYQGNNCAQDVVENVYSAARQRVDFTKSKDELQDSLHDLQGEIDSFKQVIKMFDVMYKRSQEFIDSMEKVSKDIKEKIDKRDH